ncbi:MAG: hypothetical protein ABFD75_11290 [Smithella sp.]
MGRKVVCPYCNKILDTMTILINEDLDYVLEALPLFGSRYSKLVKGYVCLFGVTPYHIKAPKLRNLVEDMKRLFDAEAFTYQKRKYYISHEGIAEALDIVVKRDFSKYLKNHNYLKEVMINISEREEKNKSRQDEKNLRQREGRLLAGGRTDNNRESTASLPTAAEKEVHQSTEEYCHPDDLPEDVRKGIEDLKAHLGITNKSEGAQ